MDWLRNAWEFLRQTFADFNEVRATRLSAALAFYTALSLAPLLLIVIALAGLIFGQEAARGELVGQLRDLTGEQGAEAAESLLAASQPHQGGWLAGVIGLGTLIVGATGVFAQLQDALNDVWKVPQWNAPSGMWAMVRDRLLSFSMVCGMAFLLLVSLVISAFLNGIGGVMLGWWPGGEEIVTVANAGLSFLLTFAMFAMIFKILPYARPDWADVWVGAGLTTILFAVGKHLIGLYLGRAAIGSTFGAAGSFVVLLVWIYYSSMILLYGAVFTQVYATRRGSASGKALAHEGESAPNRSEMLRFAAMHKTG